MTTNHRARSFRPRPRMTATNMHHFETRELTALAARTREPCTCQALTAVVMALTGIPEELAAKTPRCSCPSVWRPPRIMEAAARAHSSRKCLRISTLPFVHPFRNILHDYVVSSLAVLLLSLPAVYSRIIPYSTIWISFRAAISPYSRLLSAPRQYRHRSARLMRPKTLRTA